MAWTTMHFAVGMGCAGAATAIGCFIFRRGWRWIPGAMTLGGIWACVPDLPRLFREDFPSLPLASTLGSKELERSLHRAGDWFFFHKQLDMQPLELALHGLFLILLFYNLAIGLLMRMEHKQRNSVIHRAYRAHGDMLPVLKQKDRGSKDDPPLPSLPTPQHELEPIVYEKSFDPADPVIARIGNERDTGS